MRGKHEILKKIIQVRSKRKEIVRVELTVASRYFSTISMRPCCQSSSMLKFMYSRYKGVKLIRNTISIHTREIKKDFFRNSAYIWHLLIKNEEQ